MDEKKILGLLGLAVRAGGVTFGVPLTLEALRCAKNGKKPLVVLEAADTSDATHKRIADKTHSYGALHLRLSLNRGALADLVGKKGGSLGAVGVKEPHLAAQILRLCTKQNPPSEENQE